MAVEADVINSIRRRVADFREPRRYTDPYYKDAVLFGVQKLSLDLGEAYSSATDVPFSQTFLLVKLGTIEICFVRASEGAEGEGDEGAETKYTSIAVPDLSVSDNNAGDSRGPSFWMGFAKALQQEYDGEIQQIGGKQNAATIEHGHFDRISLIHGGLTKRKLDPGLPVTSLSVTVDVKDVDLTWTKILREDFLLYEVYRDTVATMKTEVLIASISDNHDVDYTDEARPVGTFYYRVKGLNPNKIRTNSNIVTATVV